MKILAIGDLHLSFGQGVEKPMDIFGELWQDHAERLKEQWLASVKPEDVVIICGDLSWGLKLAEAEADFEWLRALPGRKAVFKGNHVAGVHFVGNAVESDQFSGHMKIRHLLASVTAHHGAFQKAQSNSVDCFETISGSEKGFTAVNTFSRSN